MHTADTLTKHRRTEAEAVAEKPWVVTYKKLHMSGRRVGQYVPDVARFTTAEAREDWLRGVAGFGRMIDIVKNDPSAEAKAFHAVVKERAKAIFSRTFGYPSVPFRSIGRPCFAWAMKEAARQITAEAKAAAMPRAERERRIANLEKQRVEYRDSCGRIGSDIALRNIEAELSLLRGVKP
jgi:hypothetical protein